MSKLPVTVVLPVKNDAPTLEMSLKRLQRFHKIVVIDSESQDGTDRVAAEHGAEYVSFRWNGKPPKKRTWYLNNHELETDWVLFLDADELANDAFCDEVARAIESESHVGYWLTYQNWFLGRYLKHGDPFSKLALFRPDAGRYEQVADERWTTMDVEVHEHPVLDGTLGRIKAPLAHDERRGLDSYIGKHNLYSTWEACRFLALETEDAKSWDALTKRQQFKYRHVDKWWFCWSYFFLTFLVKRGFMDGRAGFVFAALKRQYYSHIRLKIRELRDERAAQDGNSG
jgi:glycosyltransferase involved in cell wall biosynthesis